MNGTWTNAEAAAYIGCTPSTLRVWVSQKKVPHLKIGRLVRFQKADLDAWLAVRRVDSLTPNTAQMLRDAYEQGKADARAIDMAIPHAPDDVQAAYYQARSEGRFLDADAILMGKDRIGNLIREIEHEPDNNPVDQWLDRLTEE